MKLTTGFFDTSGRFRHDQHLDAGGDQEGAEDVEDPVVFLHQRRADADHDAAQHDHRDDAPDQGAVLVLPRDSEEGEDQADDEDVVDGQRLLDEEAGEVGQAGMRAVGRGDLPGLVGPPDRAAVEDREADVEGREPQALRYAHLLVLLVEDAEVEGEQGDDDAEEARPHPDGFADPLGGKEFHDGQAPDNCAKPVPDAIRAGIA
jgi:hypothetical protein